MQARTGDITSARKESQYDVYSDETVVAAGSLSCGTTTQLSWLDSSDDTGGVVMNGRAVATEGTLDKFAAAIDGGTVFPPSTSSVCLVEKSTFDVEANDGVLSDMGTSTAVGCSRGASK
jgi:hypothetical protein